jgi:hypothetical protein
MSLPRKKRTTRTRTNKVVFELRCRASGPSLVFFLLDWFGVTGACSGFGND